MENESKKIIPTKEAAKILNVKTSTIHKYVRENVLKPVYEDDWQIDTSKLFYKDDILELKKKFEKPGLTTSQAAKLLGLHPTSVSLYIQKGLIKAEKKPYKGREIYFIQPEDLELFKSSYVEKKKWESKDFYNKKKDLAWFQPFTHSTTNEYGRILFKEDKETPILVTNFGQNIPINKIKEKGFTPLYSIPDINYINKKGYAKFKLDYKETPHCLEYEIIDLFYTQLGPKNMKLNMLENTIHIEVKPIRLTTPDIDKIFAVLNTYIIEGKILKRHDGIFIDSDIDTVTFSLPIELKKTLKEEAGHLTLEEYVLKIVKNRHSTNNTN